MTTNLFVIANVKQFRTGGSFRILLPFFRISWGVGILTSAIFNSIHSRLEFDTILEGLQNFRGGGGFEPPPPLVRHWCSTYNLCSPTYHCFGDSLIHEANTIQCCIGTDV